MLSHDRPVPLSSLLTAFHMISLFNVLSEGRKERNGLSGYRFTSSFVSTAFFFTLLQAVENKEQETW